MLRTIIIVGLLLSGGFFMTGFLVGYPLAGKNYISKHREIRKSVRPGSTYIYGGYFYGGRTFGSGSFRGGGK